MSRTGLPLCANMETLQANGRILPALADWHCSPELGELVLLGSMGCPLILGSSSRLESLIGYVSVVRDWRAAISGTIGRPIVSTVMSIGMPPHYTVSADEQASKPRSP